MQKGSSQRHRVEMLRLRATVSRTDHLEEQGRRGRKVWAVSAAPGPGGMKKQQECRIKTGFPWLMAQFFHFSETSTLKSKGFSKPLNTTRALVKLPQIDHIPENSVNRLDFSEAVEASQWAESLAHCRCTNKSICQNHLPDTKPKLSQEVKVRVG